MDVAQLPVAEQVVVTKAQLIHRIIAQMRRMKINQFQGHLISGLQFMTVPELQDMLRAMKTVVCVPCDTASQWDHPAKDCPTECWDRYYGIRESY